MPIYDHICDHCGHAFSVVRSYSDPPVEQCPSCGKRPRRLITPSAIVFKGSGWYKTDSRASSGASKDGDAAKPAGGASTTDGAKTPEKKGSGTGPGGTKGSSPASEAAS